MKKCPACGYGNPAAFPKCAVCGRSMAGVPARTVPAPERRSGDMRAAALLLVGCTLLFYSFRNFAWNAPAAPPAPDESPEPAGIVYSLERMAELRFLPEEDKERAARLLFSLDERVAVAAAKTAGAWARAERDPALALPWLGKLLEAAAAGKPEVRRQAALEAGLALLYGFPPGRVEARVREVSGLLAVETDPELKGSGFLLSSMAGLEDYVPQMRRALSGDPLRSVKLYAACALSRLGDSAGHAYLSAAVSSGDQDLAPGAVSCLAYSASPEAERLLLAAAQSQVDAMAAENAKMALMLRKQLAIIKK